jgi:methionine S-methyltransferase
MPALDPKDFLNRCSTSSQNAYESLKNLLDESLDTQSRSRIRCFLTQLKRESEERHLDTDSFLQTYHFAFTTLTLDGHNHTDKTLTLLQLPSIFTPEDWSFTFYEGLARYPASEFQGRTIAELGCGNGWIAIAMAQRNLPQKFIGLDINPRAITCARLNLLLNALDDSGTPILDSEGRTLLDRVEFHTSDLLQNIMERKIHLDRVIGCIPQVLSPEPLLTNSFISENADDTYLYSLSNYCEKQGYIEDQFGLGLIARALEEFIEVGKASAKIILNMGGRPGAPVLERLFKRRGFSIRKIWSTKVWQASDTDISPLVEIEKASPHRFEFFTSLSSDESICAQTAQAYANQGGRIAHSLSVYEAQLKQSSSIKSLFNLIRQSGFEDSRNSVDLSFNQDEVADEKINFIGSLSEWLQKRPNLPYSDTEGEPQLRRQIAQYLRSYWRIPLTAKSVFIAPDRRSLIKNYLQILQPHLTLIEKGLSNVLAVHQGSRLEAPRRIDELCKLIERLKPNLVITSLQDFEVKTSDAFVRLSDVCKNHSTRLIIDLSQQFDLSSQPENHGVLSFIADHSLPSHVSLLFGLVKNKVYSDLEICFLISENHTLLEHLTAAAELSYSRTPLLTQKYYSRIFADLLNFQLTDVRKIKGEEFRLPQKDLAFENSHLPSFVRQAFSHASVQAQHLPIKTETIRLDYGENCLRSPLQVHAAIIESFLRQNVSSSDLNVEHCISQMASLRFGLEGVPSSSVVLGNGVAPLFAAVLELISDSEQKILIPQGSYGYFSAACDFYNVKHAIAKTHSQNRFKISAQDLDSTLSLSGGDWLYLNAPIVNPTGSVYSSGELSDIFDVLNNHRCGIIIDTIFSGLEFNKKQTFVKLNRFFNDTASSRVPLFMLGGLSKELAAGGLRFGWALSPDDQSASQLRLKVSSQPHFTVRYAARKIYQALVHSNHPIHETLEEQRELLKNRSKRLSAVLVALGWDVIEPEGGLFLCASPKKYLENYRNRDPKILSNDVTRIADDIAQSIFTSTGLLLNSATWTGLPSHLRFVLSVEEAEFEGALSKLRDFDTAWQNSCR